MVVGERVFRYVILEGILVVCVSVGSVFVREFFYVIRSVYTSVYVYVCGRKFRRRWGSVC